MPILTPRERLGTTVDGTYEIREILGEGGMGVVFGGVHRWTERPIAIKVLRRSGPGKSVSEARFLREGKLAAKIDHPNVIRVLDVGRTEDGCLFLAMERLEGESLRERLDRGGPLSPGDAVRVVVPILEGLAAAHEAGIVHRDLKPDNLFLAQGRRGVIPKILDFGIAKTHDATSTPTKTGDMVGTYMYMSPEQIRDSKAVTPAADVWSMGVVLYQTLSGQRPFAGSETAVILDIITKEPTPLRERMPDLPPGLAEAVESALRRDPEARPGARALAARLREVIAAAEESFAESYGEVLLNDIVSGAFEGVRIEPADSAEETAVSDERTEAALRELRAALPGVGERAPAAPEGGPVHTPTGDQRRTPAAWTQPSPGSPAPAAPRSPLFFGLLAAVALIALAGGLAGFWALLRSPVATSTDAPSGAPAPPEAPAAAPPEALAGGPAAADAGVAEENSENDENSEESDDSQVEARSPAGSGERSRSPRRSSRRTQRRRGALDRFGWDDG